MVPTYVPVATVRPLYAATTAPFAVTGTTAQTPTGLAVPVEAGRVYVVQAGIIFSSSNTTAAAGLSWTGPPGATMRWNSTTGSLSYRPTLTSVDTYTGSAGTRLTVLVGRLVTGAEPGALMLTLGISDAVQTATLAADSWVMLTRVA